MGRLAKLPAVFVGVCLCAAAMAQNPPAQNPAAQAAPAQNPPAQDAAPEPPAVAKECGEATTSETPLPNSANALQQRK